jgi:CPA2 family monovalent cation:H+ antiporter-2
MSAWLAGLICHWLRLPLVLGFIAAGVALNPATWGPVVSEIHELELLADVGVALLLFTVGMEFPLPRLSQVGKVALFGAPLQVGLTILWGVGLGHLLGWRPFHGLWLGALLSLSSTVVVLRCLAQRGYLNSLASQVMIGILVVQDLCSVPILLILPELGREGSSAGSVGRTLLSGCLFVAIWLWMGRTLLPWGFRRIAQTRSRELFSLTVLAFGLGTGYVAWQLGLSLAFGAFLAGLVLAESDYAHQALHDVAPLRDLFTLIFFASVGLLIDPVWALNNWKVLLPLGLGAWIGKGFILAAIVRAFGYTKVVPFAVAFYMGQMGELAFVVARLGQKSQALTPDLYKILITQAAFSMTLTPLVARWTEPIYRFWRKLRPDRSPAPILTNEVETPHGVTIVVGFGRVGRVVAGTLRSLELPLVVVERDAVAALRAKEAGYPMIFGESTAPEVLEAAGLGHSRNIIFTYREAITLQLSVELVSQMAGHLPILARAETLEQVTQLRQAGASQVVWPEMEGALEMVHQSLSDLGLSGPDAQVFIEKIRQQHYWEVAEENAEQDLVNVLRSTWRQSQTELIRPQSRWWSDQSLANLDLRGRTGATVLGIVRENASLINPAPETVLQEGDGLWIFGDEEQRTALRELLEQDHA